MGVKVFPVYYGGKLMPWGKGAVAKGAKGFVWVAGAEAQDPTIAAEGYDLKGQKVAASPEAQTKLCFEKLKSALEEMGSSLNNIVMMNWYVKGPFPDGIVHSPNFCPQVMEEFFREHCPERALGVNPVPIDLIGVASLALKDMFVEISCVAALTDD